VSFFSDPGENVLDLFAGSGTFGLACLILGRHYFGCELDLEWARRAEMRLHGALSDRDRERLGRFIALDREPVSALKEGPSLARAAARASDKDRARAFLLRAVA